MEAQGLRIGFGLVVAILSCALSTSAFAVDGVLEINQACVAQGCFPGDPPGFPVVIERHAPASYRLTSSLQVPEADVTAILIADDHVVLDLNGFAISGVTLCSGAPLSCTPTGMGDGITTDTGRVGIEVRNGIVRGMGDRGVSLGNEARVDRVLAISNGSEGILVGQRSLVSRCRAVRNGSHGIDAVSDSLVQGNVASDNGGSGIRGWAGSLVVGNASNLNGGDGIFGTVGLTVTGNTATGNATGIYVLTPQSPFETASTVTNNTVVDNASNGITSGNSATISGNTIFRNGGHGLNFGAQLSGYGGNVLRGNASGEVLGGIEIDTNLCGSNTTCP